MKESDPALLAARDQARLIRAGELTAVGLLEACLARVERHDGVVNAIVTRNPRALEEARAVDERLTAGEDPGPLAGLVVGIKDVTEVAGLRTTYGSRLFADHIPADDALVVRRIREAGAVILGKTNTPEFAAGGNTWNEVFGVTRNPWDTALSAGGSTGGGAAALATGMISLAQGTDLGGSLRIPASFCGVAGLRPTAGLIPTHPSAYLWDDLQVTGVLARTSGDVGLALGALAGPSPLSPLSSPASGDLSSRGVRSGEGAWRLAYCVGVADMGVDSGVESACRAAVDGLAADGAEVEEIELDLSWGREAFLALRGYWFVAQLFEGLDRIEEYGPNVAANLRAGLEVGPRDLGSAENARRRMRERFLELFDRHDALLTPCMAVPPFPAEENFPTEIAGRPMETYIDWVAPTFLLSLPGLPVGCAPAGLDPRGLPVGLQIVVPPFGEARAIALGEAIEAVRGPGLPPLVSDSGAG